jgi:hypothetical protein
MNTVQEAIEVSAQNPGYVSINGKSVPVYEYVDRSVDWTPEIANRIMWSKSFQTSLVKDNLGEVLAIVSQGLQNFIAATEKLANDDSLKQYVPEVREQKLAEKLTPLYKQVFSPLDTVEAQTRKTFDFADSLIMEVTEPVKAQGQEAILVELRAQEIRRLLREMDSSDRKNAVEAKLAEGDLSYIHAVMSAPDEIIDNARIRLMRELYAKTRYGWILNMKQDYEKLLAIISFVRKGIKKDVESLSVDGNGFRIA